MIKKLLAGSIFSIIVSLGVMNPVIANTASLSVEVNPNPIKVSEFADVTIKALNSAGNVNTGASDIDIWIEVDGFNFNDQDVVIPGGGIGFMEPSDLGVKIFSKGLTIKRPGTYTLRAVSVYDSSIMGETEVQVLADSGGPATGNLTVTSPQNNEVLSSSMLTIAGTTSFANTPLVIIIDDQEMQEGLSDQQGNFTMNVSGIEVGTHVLEINALDLNDQVVATSGPINFEFSEESSPMYLGIEVTPSAVVKVREEVTMTILTAERVTSALIKVGEDGTMQPTTQIEPGRFEKVFTFDEPGTYPVDVRLFVGTTSTDFNDVEAVVVQDESRKILTLENDDDAERSRSDLTWTYEGLIEYFKVRYGTSRTNLRLSLTTSRPEGTLILADPTQTYFAQVFPVDEDGIVNGEPSEIIQIGPLREADPVCGNGIVEPGEQCDDGNIIDGDGCSSECMIEVAVCGNGILEPGEQCDDGNTIDGDGCSAECAIEIAVCGNGTVEPGEQCDDGNLVDGDGCSSECMIESTNSENSAAPRSCYTDGIALSTREVNGRYYITWDSVPLAREYVVYRADSAVGSLSQMRVIARTGDTMFEYPFDPNAEADKWAWYAVEAVCDETEEQKQVGNIEKIKVGPENTIIFLILLLIIGFGSVRVVKGMRG